MESGRKRRISQGNHNSPQKKSWKKYSPQEIQILDSALKENRDIDYIIKSNLLPGRDKESLERKAKKIGFSNLKPLDGVKQTQQGNYNILLILFLHFNLISDWFI